MADVLNYPDDVKSKIPISVTPLIEYNKGIDSRPIIVLPGDVRSVGRSNHFLKDECVVELLPKPSQDTMIKPMNTTTNVSNASNTITSSSSSSTPMPPLSTHPPSTQTFNDLHNLFSSYIQLPIDCEGDDILLEMKPSPDVHFLSLDRVTESHMSPSGNSFGYKTTKSLTFYDNEMDALPIPVDEGVRCFRYTPSDICWVLANKQPLSPHVFISMDLGDLKPQRTARSTRFTLSRRDTVEDFWVNDLDQIFIRRNAFTTTLSDLADSKARTLQYYPWMVHYVVSGPDTPCSFALVGEKKEQVYCLDTRKKVTDLLSLNFGSENQMVKDLFVSYSNPNEVIALVSNCQQKSDSSAFGDNVTCITNTIAVWDLRYTKKSLSMLDLKLPTDQPLRPSHVKLNRVHGTINEFVLTETFTTRHHDSILVTQKRTLWDISSTSLAPLTWNKHPLESAQDIPVCKGIFRFHNVVLPFHAANTQFLFRRTESQHFQALVRQLLQPGLFSLIKYEQFQPSTVKSMIPTPEYTVQMAQY